jgi:hypothetical protein
METPSIYDLAAQLMKDSGPINLDGTLYRSMVDGRADHGLPDKYPINNLRFHGYAEMQGLNFDHLLNDTSYEDEITSRRSLIKQKFEEVGARQRNPMSQPVFTPIRGKSLNKPARANGWEQNRINYQKLHDRACKCTDASIDLKDYEIMEYAIGNKFRKHNGLDWPHFDWVSPAGKSFNPTNKQLRYHFICWRDEVCTVVNAVKK